MQPNIRVYQWPDSDYVTSSSRPIWTFCRNERDGEYCERVGFAPPIGEFFCQSENRKLNDGTVIPEQLITDKHSEIKVCIRLRDRIL